MSLFSAFILGIVEGLTEFLPVSSAGHLILTARTLGIAQTDFLKSFEIAIQMGAILSVLVLYWKKLIKDLQAVSRVIVAFLPTAVFGLIFYKMVKRHLLGNELVVIWSLFLGGLFLIIFELTYLEHEKTIDEVSRISYKQSFIIGLFQSLAIIPGVSRAGATIIGGLFLNIKRKTIVEFSFLLAVPTMAAATVLDLSQSSFTFSSGQWSALGVGFLTSFVVALLAVKSLLYFIRRHNFIIFGAYRMLVALLFWMAG